MDIIVYNTIEEMEIKYIVGHVNNEWHTTL